MISSLIARLARLVPRFDGDGHWLALGNASYSFALAVASIALPLQAISSGYSAVEVGVLTAVSAISQMTSRLFLGRVMRRIPDWAIVASACVLLAGSCLIVVGSSALIPFVIAQLTQGVSRACFWTGSQTHVVRGNGSSVKALASVNLVGNLGLLSGPVAAGFLIGSDAHLALLVAAGVALLSLLPTYQLECLPPFKRLVDRHPGHLWQRPGVWEGCHAGVTAGAWRGLLGSYVPLVLIHVGHSAPTVGVLVTVANTAAILGAWLVRHLEADVQIRRALLFGTPLTGLAIATVGPLASNSLGAGIALTFSGIGAGALQILGPATAADAVHEQERGEAIAVTGTFRAASLFVAPLATAGMVAILPIGAAMAVTGVLMAVPLGHRKRSAPPK